MKFTIDQKDLRNALLDIRDITDPKTTSRILNSVRIETTTTGIALIAMNLDDYVWINLKADVVKDGVCVVPSKKLRTLLSKGPACFEVSDDETFLRVSAEGRGSKLFLSDRPYDFPSPRIPSGEPGDEYLLNREALLGALRPVVPFLSRDETRAALCGVRFEPVAGGLRLTATDGHALATSTLPDGAQVDCLVRRPAATALSRLLARSAHKLVRVSRFGNDVYFVMEGVRLKSRLIDARYPDIQAVLPEEMATDDSRVTFDRKEAVDALKHAKKLVKKPLGLLKLVPGEGRVDLLVDGDVVASFGCEGSTAPTSYNVAYLIRALNACTAGECTLESTGSLSPTFIRGTYNTQTLWVVMPMRG